MISQRPIFRRAPLWGLLCGLTLAVAQLFTPAGVGTALAATTSCTPDGPTQNCTVTFAYSGAAETWTAPDGVTQATFDLYGAQGGDNGSVAGGRGGRVTATLNVTSGANYQILIGGAGSSSGAGFNGGGSGNFSGGGGASDVRTGAFALDNRVLVAGGGGGAGGPSLGAGGAGGYPNGGRGADGGFSGGGGGGTQTSGGAGGLDDGGAPGGAGTLGQGGNSGGGSSYGGGGGGGYYGGGGGAITADGFFFDGSGGGGGSSYGPTDATFQNGVRAGDGLVIITYTQSDKLAPVANPTQSPLAALSGWNNTNVTVAWNWTDSATGSGYAAGIDAANCTTSSISSGEGTLTLSTTCKDVANNQHTATYTVKVDKTAPVVAVTGVSNGATYTVGSVPTAGCSTTDGVSGVATLATLSSSGGNPDGTGSFTITCSGATDVAGNSAAPTSVSYTVNAQINSSVSQQSVSAVYNATPQACSSTGGNLPIHTIMPTLRNTTSTTFTGLFFRVKTLEYTTTQSGQPVLCNASSGNGGVGSTLAIPNSSLPGGDNQFNPSESLAPTFQVGLPVRAQFRFFIELYAVGAAAATTDATQAGEYLGSFVYTFNESGQETSGATQLFLPLINR